MLVVLLNTQVGLALRATGDNLAMGEANGIKVDRMKILRLHDFQWFDCPIRCPPSSKQCMRI